jgi:hypothetical protein
MTAPSAAEWRARLLLVARRYRDDAAASPRAREALALALDNYSDDDVRFGLGRVAAVFAEDPSSHREHVVAGRLLLELGFGDRIIALPGRWMSPRSLSFARRLRSVWGLPVDDDDPEEAADLDAAIRRAEAT